jgi:hypothetical protein
MVQFSESRRALIAIAIQSGCSVNANPKVFKVTG